MRVLIVSNMHLRRHRPRYTANLGLIWGLEAHDIKWRIRPSESRKLDLEGYDAVLSWWSRPKKPLYQTRFWNPVYDELTPGPEHRLSFEAQLSERCRELGIPLINAFSKRRHLRHSRNLQTWRDNDVPSPRCEKIESPQDISLEAPLVVGIDAKHSARNLTLIRSPRDARKHFAECASSDRPAPNLALDFIDTADSDGLYRKRRCFVVGEQVLPRQQLMSRHWQVNLSTALGNEQAVDEDRQFMADGEPDAELVQRAVQVLGPEICAIDYTRRPDGGFCFWRASAIFRMAGLDDDEMSERFRAVTRRSPEDCHQEHVRFGEAIVELIHQRVAQVRG